MKRNTYHDDYEALIELAAEILESDMDDQDVIQAAREILAELKEGEEIRQ
ncbi:MAG: hypothetical protein ACP5GH_07020 [Nitrososphaeria archaeon]